MESRRLALAIGLSLAIILVWEYAVRPLLPHAPPSPAATETAEPDTAPPKAKADLTPSENGPDAAGAEAPVPKDVPRLPIDGAKVQGSISLLGARIDDLVLLDYHETVDPGSPSVRLLEPRSDERPYFVQYGWIAETGQPVPDDATVWTASAPALRPGQPVTLSWDNGHGLTFSLVVSVDDDYLFTVEQRVRNGTGKPVQVTPYARARQDYQPKTAGYAVLFEGMIGVVGDRLQQTGYNAAKSAAAEHDGVAFTGDTQGGWAGFTDKYWLTALVPDPGAPSLVRFVKTQSGYQVDARAAQPEEVAPDQNASVTTHLFAGAKVVRVLRGYENRLGVKWFTYAVDWGHLYFLTQPFFAAIDWLYGLIGNFGLAILTFTVIVKAVFFPLANYSFRSMSRMKLLGPKIQSLKERIKDDPARLQQEMMQLYRAEKVNPASGCLPMVVQIPVFFALYKVIFVTIEMRQAPFFGWIHDLSQADPTNVFNLFGLVPFNPVTILPLLHLGVWPMLMGGTMYLQQKLNPAPPDPTQARLFQLMPVVFTFMLASFPAGLVIYYTWNNLLSIAQQWLIQRRTTLPRPDAARA